MARAPLAGRELTAEEGRILGLIQDHYGPQNDREELTWLADGVAVLLVTDQAGEQVLMANLTNLAVWRAGSVITESQLLTDYLLIQDD
ncbi:MAG: hypothetical protein P1V81_10885 [Planctomycetota bacterium]|nr:hypothetical protein [Planctomycetota bacterium]